MEEYFSVISRRVFKQLLCASNILLVCHKKPDADTLGSALSMKLILDQYQKRSYVFCVDTLPANLFFLSTPEMIFSDIAWLRTKKFNTIIVFDSSDLEHTGIAEFLSTQVSKIINIDHHTSNTYFGDINVVLPTASSTTEVVFSLFEENKLKINRSIAQCLLAGVLSDTYLFSNPATSSRCLQITAHFLEQGILLHKVINKLEIIKSYQVRNLFGEVLAGIQYSQEFNCAIAVVSKDMLKKHELKGSEIDGIANFVASYCNFSVILVLRQLEQGLIKGSLRTIDSKIDLSALAKILGGGGHAKASGFVIKGNLINNNGQWQIE